VGPFFDEWGETVARHPELRLMLVGDGPFTPKIKARVKEHGLEGRVLLDQVDEARAGEGEEGDAGVERPHEVGVAAGLDGGLGREEADAAVPG